MNFPLNEIYNTIQSKIDIYASIAMKTHKIDAETARRVIDSELEIYMNRLSNYEQEDLADTKRPIKATLTIPQGVNIFLEVQTAGLSFSQTANHVYLSRLKGTGTAVGYQLTADGSIYSAQKAGAIDHLSEPVLVQNGESFSILSTSDGRQIAEHRIVFDGRPSFNFDQLLLGYVYIVYPNGDRELSWISKNRLAEYRNKSVNKSLYNDESFIQTKVIKHALRKVRKTSFMTSLLADDDETIQENRVWEEEEQLQETNTAPPFNQKATSQPNTVEPFGNPQQKQVEPF